MTYIEQLDEAFASSLREQWRARTVETVWLRPGDWYDPAVDAMTEAVAAGMPAAPAAFRLGEMRGAAGVGITEALDDVAVLFEIVGTEPDLEVVRSLCAGWAGALDSAPVRMACIDPETGVPTADYLAVRLAETYGAVTAPATHCLVLIDVATADLHPWHRMARSAAMGRALAVAMPSGHPMASLGGGAFAVLVARDADLGETVRRMRGEVEDTAAVLHITDLLRQPPRIWVEPLPATHRHAVDLLEQLRR